MSLSRRPCLEINIAHSRRRTASMSSESPSSPSLLLGGIDGGTPGSGSSIQLLAIEQVEEPSSWGSPKREHKMMRARAVSMPERVPSLVSFADDVEYGRAKRASDASSLSSSIPIPSALDGNAEDSVSNWDDDHGGDRIRNNVSGGRGPGGVC